MSTVRRQAAQVENDQPRKALAKARNNPEQKNSDRPNSLTIPHSPAAQASDSAFKQIEQLVILLAATPAAQLIGACRQSSPS